MFGPHRLPCETPEAHRPEATFGPANPYILPATILGSSLGFIDGSVVNVGLPAIQRGLGADLGGVQWVVNGYMLMLGSLVLLGGSAADRYGRRRMFLIGLVAFTLASLVAGLAPDVTWLVAARLAQGVAAALLTPASLAIIGTSYQGEARGPAIGAWAAAGALTTALGPPLGGFLIDGFGWRMVFFVNLPVAALTLVLALRIPDDPGSGTAAPLDWQGAVLGVAALGLLSYGLIALGRGESLAGGAAVFATLPVAALFVAVEARSPAPMMPLALFANRTFAGANGLTLLLYASLSGALFLLPFVLIEVHGYAAAAAGAAFLPFSVLMGLGSRWAGRLVEVTGARLPLMLGSMITAAGYLILALSSRQPDYWTGFLPGLIVLGLGMTLSVAPLTTTVFDAAPEAMGGAASGINNAAARSGSLIAIAALGLAFGGSGDPAAEGRDLLAAYSMVMIVAALLAVLSALIAALTIAPRRQDAEERQE